VKSGGALRAVFQNLQVSPIFEQHSISIFHFSLFTFHLIMFSRREFIKKNTIAFAGLAFLPFGKANAGEKEKVMTVSGPMDADAMGFSLSHEHVLVDFIGAEKYSKERYDANDVYQIALPHLVELKKTGCQTFVDCSPAYLGRDVTLLKKLADASGLNIITNTGYYGAVQEKFLPRHVYTESAEQLAARWTKEFREGIEGTGIKPGFIKTSTDKAPLTAAQKKIITAAGLAHKATGLTILVHTGNGAAANEQVDILKKVGVDMSARVWTHSQNETDMKFHIDAARNNGWVAFDGVNPESVDANIACLQRMKSEKLLQHVLVSQDSGWYNVGEPSGGNFRPYTCISTQLIPRLRESGFTSQELDLIFKTNPAKAFSIKVRMKKI
jgi:predicted metal-dependent phosphotriesterase family hydrolase